MKIAAGLAVIGAVVGELVSGVINHPPTGALIAQGLRNSNLPLVFGAVLTSALIGFLLFGVVVVCESMSVDRWHLGINSYGGSPENSQVGLKILGLFALIVFTGLLPSQRELSDKPKLDLMPSTVLRRFAIRIQLNWFPDPQFGGFYAAELWGILMMLDSRSR